MNEILGSIFVIIAGTLSHFCYEWSNHNKVVALFCAVNESTWEHIKIALGPTFLWIIIEITFMVNSTNFFFAKAISLLTIILFIPLFFYIYRWISKKDIIALDILDFILAIILSNLLSHYIMNLQPVNSILTILSITLIIVIFLCYLMLTFFPIDSFLFKDPINKKTGLNAHMDIDEYKIIQRKK